MATTSTTKESLQAKLAQGLRGSLRSSTRSIATTSRIIARVFRRTKNHGCEGISREVVERNQYSSEDWVEVFGQTGDNNSCAQFRLQPQPRSPVSIRCGEPANSPARSIPGIISSYPPSPNRQKIKGIFGPGASSSTSLNISQSSLKLLTQTTSLITTRVLKRKSRSKRKAELSALVLEFPSPPTHIPSPATTSRALSHIRKSLRVTSVCRPSIIITPGLRTSSSSLQTPDIFYTPAETPSMEGFIDCQEKRDPKPVPGRLAVPSKLLASASSQGYQPSPLTGLPMESPEFFPYPPTESEASSPLIFQTAVTSKGKPPEEIRARDQPSSSQCSTHYVRIDPAEFTASPSQSPENTQLGLPLKNGFSFPSPSWLIRSIIGSESTSLDNNSVLASFPRSFLPSSLSSQSTTSQTVISV